ncbi:MAG: MFS transporter [Methylobacteriaceae bacterium]|nr:MFS transporter [Methylobacteriaceae bacterium]
MTESLQADRCSSESAPRSTPGRPEQRATRIGFFILGLATATWAPLVPFAKARAGLDEGGLGLLLFGIGAGAILAMPPAGALAAHFGCRRVLLASALLICLALPLLATASSVPLLAVALIAFGAGAGAFDCVVNVEAIIVERASRRALMSGFHGLYSLGGMIGAAGVSALLGAGSSPLGATFCMGAIIVVALALAAPNLLPYGSEARGPAFAVPRGAVLLIGVLCLILFLTEGAVLDWSAVFLTAVRGVSPSRAGLGYAVFALAMTFGRLAGDRIVGRAGGANVITFGSFCAAGGLALATLVPSWETGLLGYFLVGAGCSNIVPVLYSAVGRQTATAEHVAVAAASTIGYIGTLGGPAAIGFLAQATSLSSAFLVLALLLLGVAAAGRALYR